MANYTTTLPSTRTAEEAFAYLADFRSVAEWDPSVVSASLSSDGAPVRVGARFTVVVSILGRTTSMDYETIELESPHRIVLRGENATAVSVDTVTVRPGTGGSSVTYNAQLSLKGVLRLADPLMGLVLGRLGANAKRGLEAELNR